MPLKKRNPPHVASHTRAIKALEGAGLSGVVITRGEDGMIRTTLLGARQRAGEAVLHAMKNTPWLATLADFTVNGTARFEEMVAAAPEEVDTLDPDPVPLEEIGPFCATCDTRMNLVRPGKWQCENPDCPDRA